MKKKMEMKKKLTNIGLAVILVIGVFAGIMGIASAQTHYNESGKYIEGTNVSVNTSVAFNMSRINVPLTFQINNTLNDSATSFNVTNQSGLTTNATGRDLAANEWFWVNASSADTYWVNVSNNDNQSEYVNFTVEYSPPVKYIEGINVSVNTSEDFNRSYINIPLTFQINNTLNESATNFSVTNQSGLTTNATDSMDNDSWFWVNATEAGTYWVNVSNNDNQSEYVNFTVEYSSITVTYYNENGRYIEGINVSVNTSEYFNRSFINDPLMFQINNTLNDSATNFSVDNQSGSATNATGRNLSANEWFWVNASSEGTYWVNVSNNDNRSEYVNFTVEYSNITITIQTIRIRPKTLNLGSKGVFTAFITLPEDYTVTDINISTVECEGAPAVRGMVSEEDDGTYIAKFNRQNLTNMPTGDAVELTVTGKLNDGTPFGGNDTIRVINKGRWGPAESVPGQWFHGVKKWAEGVHKKMFFTFDDDAKARLQVDKGAQPKIPVIIGFKDKPGQADKDIIRGHGGDIKHSYTIINAIAAKLPEQAIDKIKKNPRVAYVEMDGEMHTLDTELDNSWGVKRIGAGTVHADNKGTGVEVAIIDTGIDYTHSDLDANYKGGYDYVNDDTDPIDDNGHGTHCAGIVAAEDNGEGVVGAAPEANLYGVKVLNSEGRGYESDVIAGIEWSVENGMQVISMSLGSDFGSISLKNACNNASSSGVLLVAAAGNDGNPPGKGDNVDYPARYDSVIAVAATNSNDERAKWSSTGQAVELSAPGVSIYSTYLGGYATKSGTSMACPHVSGTAALVIAFDSSLSNDEVRLRLQKTADDLGATGFDTKYGYGLVDADEAASQSDATPPAQVTGLTVTTVSSRRLDLAWDANTETDFDHYNVCRSTTSGGLYDLVASPTTNSYSDTGLAASTTYYYTVSAMDIAGNEGMVSGEANGTTNEAVANVMHVSNITMWYDTRGPNYFIYTKVTLVDSEEAPVPEATVYLETVLQDKSTVSDSGSTNSEGTVTFKLKSRQIGTYNSTVTDVVKTTDWSYDSTANVRTDDSITVP